MRILIDMDGVLADFETGFLEDWQRHHPEKSFVTLEERNTFYLHEQYPVEYVEEVHRIYSSPNFFRKIRPVPGGLEAVREMKAMGLEIFFCTSPLKVYEYCVVEKYQWVEEHLGHDWTRQIVLTSDKTIVKGDILIDDKPIIEGVEKPSWEHVIYDQPYNRVITGQRRLTWANWKNVLFPD